jgi:hypothetical protein
MSEELKQPQQSSADLLKLDHMEKCKCDNNLEVMFVCLDKSCADNQTHPYYCMKCSQKKHKHHMIFIINEVEEQHIKWTTLRE